MMQIGKEKMSNKAAKILIIDPWCADKSNLYYYTTGLAAGISEYADVTVICQKNCTTPEKIKYNLIKRFFPVSYKLKRGGLRLVVRGFEYIWAYFVIILSLKRNNFDVIHVEWPLLYVVDKVVFKYLRKSTKLFVLKAHNVLPHSSGARYVNVFREIYSIPDVILLHGEKLKEDFADYFPDYMNKIEIQRHGVYLNHSLSYDVNLIDDEVKKKIQSRDKVYLYFGSIHYDKGVDRLIKIWVENFSTSNSLLIVAGSLSGGYKDFVDSERIMEKCENILYLKGFAEDNLLNYLFSKCNLVILPYRTGSMSGVVFTCAEFSTPVLSTDFGTIREYVQDKVTGFIVENDDESLKEVLKSIDTQYTKEVLSSIGDSLHKSFMENYDWKVIGEKLVREVYAVCI
jgi:glycosyltransferase involved in cell wall biosynthesis